MQDLIQEILENDFRIYRDKEEIKTYEINNIEYRVCKYHDYICINAFNDVTERAVKLDTKKYGKLIDRLKKDSNIVTTKEGEIHIKFNKNNGSINIINTKIIGYVRVSTKGQLDGNSIEEQTRSILERYPTANIIEESYSAAKDREIFNNILHELKNGDTLVITKLDRFCRTAKEGLQYIDLLMDRGVKIHILNMGLIEDTPMGRLIVTNLLAFAEFERAMIIERTQSGKAIARTKAGFKEGRPKSYTKYQLDNALALLTINGGDNSYKEVVKLTQISKSTLIREQRKRNL
ncbi:recombinase family protein [Clostridium sp.]|uniref:recombinase family protein n=1 Tax=Clostridium sp. TaxID=1506 RepID=UPI003F2CB9A8